MDYKDIKAHFKIKSDHGDTCKAMCPSHPDKQASLSIKYDKTKGVTMLKCFAGCETEEIVRAAGLQMTDLFDKEFNGNKSSDNNISAVYKYKDANGNLLFEKVRFDKPKKHLTQRRYIGEATIWGLDEGTYYETYRGSNNWSKKKRDNVNIREFPACQPVLYNLPWLVEAIKNDKEVYIVEGEKDADNLIKMGLAATCNFDGASASNMKPKWRKEYNQYFKNARVVIFNDNDDPGIAHADYIASKLVKVAEYVKRPEIPGLLEKEDISDWINAGHTKEDILNLVESTEYWNPSLQPENVSLINFNFSDVGNAERLMAMYGKNKIY